MSEGQEISTNLKRATSIAWWMRGIYACGAAGLALIGVMACETPSVLQTFFLFSSGLAIIAAILMHVCWIRLSRGTPTDISWGLALNGIVGLVPLLFIAFAYSAFFYPSLIHVWAMWLPWAVRKNRASGP
jgi:hypothetical protein